MLCGTLITVERLVDLRKNKQRIFCPWEMQSHTTHSSQSVTEKSRGFTVLTNLCYLFMQV